VTGEEDFFLDGVLEGNITLTGKRLTVGANGVIHADIVAGDLVVFGRVEGSVKASGRAELKHSAVFIGESQLAGCRSKTTPRCKATSTSPKRPNRRKKEPVATRKPSQKKPTSMSSSTAKQSKLLEPTASAIRRPRFRLTPRPATQGAGRRVFVISTGAHPDFLLRGTGYGRVCAFL